MALSQVQSGGDNSEMGMPLPHLAGATVPEGVRVCSHNAVMLVSHTRIGIIMSR